MCTSVVEVCEAEGAGKSEAGWFPVTSAVVSYDHPHHALLEDAITIDFVNPELGPGARAAVEITAALSIPTIGIGAGVGCDGQVLVMHDMLGLGEVTPPRFVRQYVALGDVVRRAAEMYAEDVRNQKFPGDVESY